MSVYHCNWILGQQCLVFQKNFSTQISKKAQPSDIVLKTYTGKRMIPHGEAEAM